MEDDQAYWKGRIDKLNKKVFADTLLVDTWIVNNKSSIFKPFDTESEFKDLLNAYLRNRDDNGLRVQVFNRSLWYAAYISIFARQNYGRTFTWDMNHYLGFAMKRLWEDIKVFNPDESSFYTYILNDYSLRIRRETEEIYGRDNLTAGVRIRMKVIMNKAIKLGLSFSEICEMPKEEFYEIFEANKDLFIKMLAFKDIDSLNRSINESDGDCTEYGSTLEDPYSSSFAERLVKDMSIQEIYDMAEKMYSSNLRNYKIWKEYVTTGTTYEDIGKKYNLSRERVRQILNKTNNALKGKRKVKVLKEIILED